MLCHSVTTAISAAASVAIATVNNRRGATTIHLALKVGCSRHYALLLEMKGTCIVHGHRVPEGKSHGGGHVTIVLCTVTPRGCPHSTYRMRDSPRRDCALLRRDAGG